MVCQIHIATAGKSSLLLSDRLRFDDNLTGVRCDPKLTFSNLVERILKGSVTQKSTTL